LAVVRRILEKGSYRISAVSDADEAIHLCHERRIDVLVTDEFLPALSGVQLASLVHDQCRDSAILFMSGTPLEGWPTADIETLKGLMALRADFLPKPFMPKQLLAKVERLISTRDPLPEFEMLVQHAQDYQNARQL
jgi:DNA-binding response OmpR family regulator